MCEQVDAAAGRTVKDSVACLRRENVTFNDSQQPGFTSSRLRHLRARMGNTLPQQEGRHDWSCCMEWCELPATVLHWFISECIRRLQRHIVDWIRMTDTLNRHYCRYCKIIVVTDVKDHDFLHKVGYQPASDMLIHLAAFLAGYAFIKTILASHRNLSTNACDAGHTEILC